MQAFSKTNRLLYFSLSIFVIGLMVGSVLAYVLVGDMAKRATLAAASAAKEEASLKAASLAKTFASTKEEQAELDHYFVPKDGAVTFVEMLEKLALSQGIDLTTSSLSATPDPTYQYVQKINVSAEGKASFSKLLTFMKLLEQMPFKINITQFYFDRFTPPAKGQAEVWRLVVTVEAYGLK